MLDELLDKYAEHGADQFCLPDVLEVPPISDASATSARSPSCSAAPMQLREAVSELQELLYAA